MRSSHWLAASLFGSVFFVASAGSALETITVDAGGGADFTSIQPALDAARDGYVVVVKPGTYVNAEPLDFNRLHDPDDPSSPRRKDLVLLGDDPASTSLVLSDEPVDPERASVVVFRSGETSKSVLSGFSILAGRGSRPAPGYSVSGGGILCFGSSPTIVNCRIARNRALTGGGISCREAAAILISSRIEQNLAESGGGVSIYGGAVTLIGCEVRDNRALLDGGGILMPTSTRIERCSILGNLARVGGGIWLGSSVPPTVTNCIISVNFAEEEGGGVYSAGGDPRLTNCTISGNGASGQGWEFIRNGGSPTLRNTIVWGNPFSTENLVLDHSLLSIDPLFVTSPVADFLRRTTIAVGGEAEEMPDFSEGSGDLHLREGSPAIDIGTSAGAPPLDIDGSRRFCGGAIDAGAYERGACEQDEVVLDNGDLGTIAHGYWPLSSAPESLGRTSVYSRQAGAVYTFLLDVQEEGEYDLHLWWTAWPSRLVETPVEIYNFRDTVAGQPGITVYHLNQRVDGGRWNGLGRYFLAAGAVIVRVVASPEGTVSADGVKLVRADAPSSVVIDNDNPHNAWASGNWSISGAPNPYGANSLYTRDPDAVHGFQIGGVLPDINPPGRPYEVFLWWTEYPSRSGNVRVELDHSYGVSNVFVDQRTNGGRWNSIGTYMLGGGSNILRVYSSGSTTTTSADAVMAVPANTMVPLDFISDTGERYTSFTGVWSLSVGPNPYGSNSLYSSMAGASYSYRFDIPGGEYEVFLWWTSMSSRLTDVPVEVTVAPGDVRTFSVNQRVNGGKWVSVGILAVQGSVIDPMTGTSLIVTILSKGGGSTCADAVRVVRRS